MAGSRDPWFASGKDRYPPKPEEFNRGPSSYFSRYHDEPRESKLMPGLKRSSGYDPSPDDPYDKRKRIDAGRYESPSRYDDRGPSHFSSVRGPDSRYRDKIRSNLSSVKELDDHRRGYTDYDRRLGYSRSENYQSSNVELEVEDNRYQNVDDPFIKNAIHDKYLPDRSSGEFRRVNYSQEKDLDPATHRRSPVDKYGLNKNEKSGIGSYQALGTDLDPYSSQKALMNSSRIADVDYSGVSKTYASPRDEFPGRDDYNKLMSLSGPDFLRSNTREELSSKIIGDVLARSKAPSDRLDEFKHLDDFRRLKDYDSRGLINDYDTPKSYVDNRDGNRKSGSSNVDLTGRKDIYSTSNAPVPPVKDLLGSNVLLSQILDGIRRQKEGFTTQEPVVGPDNYKSSARDDYNTLNRHFGTRNSAVSEIINKIPPVGDYSASKDYERSERYGSSGMDVYGKPPKLSEFEGYRGVGEGNDFERSRNYNIGLTSKYDKPQSVQSSGFDKPVVYDTRKTAGFGDDYRPRTGNIYDEPEPYQGLRIDRGIGREDSHIPAVVKPDSFDRSGNKNLGKDFYRPRASDNYDKPAGFDRSRDRDLGKDFYKPRAGENHDKPAGFDRPVNRDLGKDFYRPGAGDSYDKPASFNRLGDRDLGKDFYRPGAGANHDKPAGFDRPFDRDLGKDFHKPRADDNYDKPASFSRPGAVYESYKSSHGDCDRPINHSGVDNRMNVRAARDVDRSNHHAQLLYQRSGPDNYDRSIDRSREGFHGRAASEMDKYQHSRRGSFASSSHNNNISLTNPADVKFKSDNVYRHPDFYARRDNRGPIPFHPEVDTASDKNIPPSRNTQHLATNKSSDKKDIPEGNEVKKENEETSGVEIKIKTEPEEKDKPAGKPGLGLFSKQPQTTPVLPAFPDKQPLAGNDPGNQSCVPVPPKDCEALQKIKDVDGPCGKNMVIIMKENEYPLLTLEYTKAQMKKEFVYENNLDAESKLWVAKMWFCKQLVATASDLAKENARKSCANLALKKLQEHYYTVLRVGGEYYSDNKVVNANGDIVPTISRKSVYQRYRHADFPNIEKVVQVIKDYASSDSVDDLVFSFEFAPQFRKQFQAMAKDIGLTVRKFGPPKWRFLVLSKKLNIWDIVLGLVTKDPRYRNRYQLLEPGTVVN